MTQALTGTAGLVLAAGESSRMGQDKALLRYRGRTFLETILATLREARVPEVVVVLGHHAAAVQRAVDLRGVTTVVNADYRRGQSSSLQAGLAALEAVKPEAVVLSLVDHPAVSSEVIRQLVIAWRDTGAPAVVPTHRGQHGHPTLIAASLFPELLALDPRQGANTVIRKYAEATRTVEVADAGVLIDVDDLATYRQLEEQ